MGQEFAFWSIGLTAPLAMAVVAVLGYLFGRSQNRADHATVAAEVDETNHVIDELEAISQRIRRSLANQHTSILAFRHRLDSLSHIENAEARESIKSEAEKILAPTLDLSSNIVEAYEQIRRQTCSLADVRKRSRDTGVEV